MRHTDLAGNEITVGVFIVYAAALGRCSILKYGQVRELTSGTADYHRQTVAKISIVSVDHNFKLQKKGGRHTLGFLDRVLVVGSGQLPEGVAATLRGAP